MVGINQKIKIEFFSILFDKLRYPAIIICLPVEALRRQVILMAVGDEDVVFEMGYY